MAKQRLTQRGATERELRAAWEQRVTAATFSAGVVGTREARVFGTSGDAPVCFPQVRTLAAGETLEGVLDLLAPDERWALNHARRVVDVHRASGRRVFAVDRRAGAVGTQAETFDPTEATDLLIVSQITGG